MTVTHAPRPAGTPSRTSNAGDVQVALKLASDHLNDGGHWGTELRRYVDCWLDRQLELDSKSRSSATSKGGSR